MAVFTPLSPADLRRAAWLFDIGRINGAEPIATGTENSNFRIDSPAGRFVLTLVESQGADEAERRLRWLADLGRAGLPVAPPRRTRDGALLGTLTGRPAVLTPWVPGTVAWSPTPDQCRAVGAFLARLHRQALPDPALPPWEGPTGLDRRLLARLPRHHRRRLATAMARREPLDGLPAGALHGDLFRDNALFRGSRLAAVVDFYGACHGPLLLDLAVAAIDWCRRKDGTLDEARCRTLTATYRAERPWSPREAQSWGACLHEAALAFYGARLARRYAAPSDGGPVRDPEELGRVLDRLSAPGALAV